MQCHLLANTAVSVFQKQTPTAPEVRQSGISYSLQYANSLTDNTNLQLLAYRYTGKDYVDFNEFNSNALYHRMVIVKSVMKRYCPKVLMVALLAYLLGCKTYRNSISNEVGANITYNTTIKSVDFSLSADYQKLNDYEHDNYIISVGINIPFSLYDKNHFWANSVSYDRKK